MLFLDHHEDDGEGTVARRETRPQLSAADEIGRRCTHGLNSPIKVRLLTARLASTPDPFCSHVLCLWGKRLKTMQVFHNRSFISHAEKMEGSRGTWLAQLGELATLGLGVVEFQPHTGCRDDFLKKKKGRK